jgi:hypothetical protein
VLVLVILLVIWAFVLIPPWIHGRREIRAMGSMQSMDSFRRRLSSIEQAVPFVDAYSDEMYLDASSHDELDLGVGDDDPAAGGLRTDLMWDEPDESVAVVHRAPVAELRARPPVARPASSLAPTPSPAARVASRAALHRRRQVFFLLLAGVAASMSAAVAVQTAVAWVVHGSFAAVFVGYVWLLVRHHQRVMDRAAKVRYLTPARTPRPAVVVLHGTGR